MSDAHMPHQRTIINHNTAAGCFTELPRWLAVFLRSSYDMVMDDYGQKTQIKK
ncbi:hypothetical protein ACNKHV_27200 [Shigella flexneri]